MRSDKIDSFSPATPSECFWLREAAQLLAFYSHGHAWRCFPHAIYPPKSTESTAVRTKNQKDRRSARRLDSKWFLAISREEEHFVVDCALEMRLLQSASDISVGPDFVRMYRNL